MRPADTVCKPEQWQKAGSADRDQSGINSTAIYTTMMMIFDIVEIVGILRQRMFSRRRQPEGSRVKLFHR